MCQRRAHCYPPLYYGKVHVHVPRNHSRLHNYCELHLRKPYETLTAPNDPSVRELLGEDGPKFLLEIGWRSTSAQPIDTMGSWRSIPEGCVQDYVTICADNLSRLGLGSLLSMLRSHRHGRRDLIRDIFEIFCPREGSWLPQEASNFVWATEEFLDHLGKKPLKTMKTEGNSAWKALVSWFSISNNSTYAMHKDIERLRKLG